LKTFGVGGGIVGNYNKLTPIFTVDSWKVDNAVHKTNGERVSLWEIDRELLEKKIPDAAQQEKYLQGCLEGIQKLRKFRHPHLLKILEVQEKTSELAFSAEPISTSLPTLIGSLNNDDAAYVCFQLAEVLQFLHSNAKIAHLGICPQAIFLDETLSIKLFNFNWTTPISPSNTIEYPFKQYADEASYPPLNYSAPEVVQCKSPGYPQSDIFSFALVFYECLTGKPLLTYKEKREYDIGRNPISSAGGVQSCFINVFKDCLHVNPQMRPDFTQVINGDAFTSMQMKILRYLDLLTLKDQKDKFIFFKNLIKTVDKFSPIMSRSKILPILIEECKNDIRFAPVLLGSIFAASSSFTVSEFTENVFKKISFLTVVIDPPQVTIALIQNLPLILEKTDQKYHADSVYPIMFNALQSNQDILQRECLKKLPVVIEKIAESAVQQTLIPRLVELANTTKETSLVSSCITSISICLDKADNDQFLRTSLPKIYEAWRKNQNAKVAVSMCDLIEKIKASYKTMLSRGIPVAADITSNSVTEPYIQRRLCDWMVKVINNYKTSGRLDEAHDPVPDVLSVESTDSVAKKPVMDAAALKSFEDFSMPASSSATKNSSVNGMSNFDFGFGTSSAAPSPAPKNDFGFGTPTKSAPNSDFGTAFNASPKPAPMNDFGSTAVFDPSPKPAPRTDNTFGSAFDASPKPAPRTDNDFGFGTPQGRSNDFAPFGSPVQHKTDTFQPFGSPQAPMSGNDFQPFGNQQPSQNFGFNQPRGPSAQRALRTTPGSNQFGGGFSAKPPQQGNQQKSNDLLDLF
jgi:SCY1-like protein 2